MTRVQKFAHALASGYLLLVVNVVYSLASVRLGWHYLSQEGFGLWVVVMQAAGYLQLIDFGMAGSISRTLIDHKDQSGGGVYGSFIKTGALVLVVQGLAIAAVGLLLSLWMADWFSIPPAHQRDFKVLFAAQCLVLGLMFPVRMAGFILQAHQRSDMCNYASILNLLVSLAAMWAGFRQGLGYYSLILGVALGSLVGLLLQAVMVVRLKLLPPARAWGRVQGSVFKELFTFGTDLFLLNVGFQLLNATQLLIVSRTCGLAGAAVWSVSTRAFLLAQMMLNQVLSFSCNALSEMVVRGEKQLLRNRFRDMLIVTAGASLFIGAGLAVCNSSFVEVWLKKVAWSPLNDGLLAVLLVVTSLTRGYISICGLTKRIGYLRFLYFFEGVSFFGLSLLLAPLYGMTAILLVAIAMDILWSGVYGVWRCSREFDEPMGAIALSWTGMSWRYLAMLLPLTLVCWGLTHLFVSGLARFLVGGVAVTVAGLPLLWRFGLTAELQNQFRGLWGKLQGRLGWLPRESR